MTIIEIEALLEDLRHADRILGALLLQHQVVEVMADLPVLQAPSAVEEGFREEATLRQAEETLSLFPFVKPSPTWRRPTSWTTS